MKQGIPGWVVLFVLLGLIYLGMYISDTIKMNNYKNSFDFNVDSLQRVINFNFSRYDIKNSQPQSGACFVFSLEDGKLIPNQALNNALPQSISPKTNPIKNVAIIEEDEISSGKYSNGSSGVKYFTTVYFFDCLKNEIIKKEDLRGSDPPSSGYVRSGGKIKGSKVSNGAIAKYIYSNLANN